MNWKTTAIPLDIKIIIKYKGGGYASAIRSSLDPKKITILLDKSTYEDKEGVHTNTLFISCSIPIGCQWVPLSEVLQEVKEQW